MGWMGSFSALILWMRSMLLFVMKNQNGGNVAHALPCMKLTENGISSCRMLWTFPSQDRNIMSNKHLAELK